MVSTPKKNEPACSPLSLQALPVSADTLGRFKVLAFHLASHKLKDASLLPSFHQDESEENANISPTLQPCMY